jgi:hypothetical protein
MGPLKSKNTLHAQSKPFLWNRQNISTWKARGHSKNEFPPYLKSIKPLSQVFLELGKMLMKLCFALWPGNYSKYKVPIGKVWIGVQYDNKDWFPDHGVKNTIQQSYFGKSSLRLDRVCLLKNRFQAMELRMN